MNFPDLETCRAIGAEFPDSEFVWVEKPNGNVRPEYRTRAECFANVFLAPAPTCEEMGEWLHSHKHRLSYLTGPNVWQLSRMDNLFRWEDVKDITAENETQARAEAVKLILETKWNPSTFPT